MQEFTIRMLKNIFLPQKVKVSEQVGMLHGEKLPDLRR
jgi:hypothetical protein